MSINVRDYGAGSGNAAIDTQAIKNAIEVVRTGSDRTLYFPHGDYYINATIDFEPWGDPWTGYTVDFGGAVIRAGGLPAGAAAFRFFNNKLLEVRGGLQLLGDPNTNGANTIGIRVDSLQDNGFDVATFEQISVSSFPIAWRLGSPAAVGKTAPNRVATVEFHNLRTDQCAVGFLIDGLVDRCRFSEVAISGASYAGFDIAQSGSLVFENCTGTGNFPLFFVEGAVNELGISSCQNGPGSDGASWNCDFLRRRQSGAGSGPPRPMLISSCAIDRPIVLGDAGATTGGATQAVFLGCTISSNVDIVFADYFVDLFGCYVVPGAVIHVNGPRSTVSSFGSKVSSGQVALANPGSNLFHPY